MAKIITIINQKGGVGKTTTAQAIGAWIQVKKNKKVLLLDIDQQGNLTYAIGARNSDYNMLEVLVAERIQADKIQLTPSKFWIIPSTPSLANVDIALTQTGKEYRLKKALVDLISYDFVVIDTPPTLNIITINALTASNYAVIPAQADIFSLQGITQLGQTIETVKRYTNKDLKVLGIVLTKHNTRSILSRDLQKVITDTAIQLQTKVYTQYVREALAVREAQAMKKDIFNYNHKSNATKDYDALMKQIWKDINQ
ncbi:Sporulation initiation inhibitor protein Soj [Arsenophonus endosymbiont of Aleurodicus floccissimus]|uniref:ParA family protein n=1 Tax=Arsenophonus endosymbiont of Aleurodicus floccissimus TaxID=2152761 RepID=UPI000E6B17FC|nr:AAA family ATPase [Arsenophonus endosymbiont of Aleurodicus floccissimus]SPP32650.1 Sporulation initiation inhibitor protein Soj [Arsenophonus endosymbiont of Aleurodicus floccissimus]